MNSTDIIFLGELFSYDGTIHWKQSSFDCSNHYKACGIILHALERNLINGQSITDEIKRTESAGFSATLKWYIDRTSSGHIVSKNIESDPMTFLDDPVWVIQEYAKSLMQ